MIRKLLTLILALLASGPLALAHDCVLQGAFGQGAAQAHSGVMAEFSFDVKKLICPNEPPRLGGFFAFSSHDLGHNRAIKIRLGMLHELGVQGNEAAFSGPGTMIVRTPQRSQTFEGAVFVHVADRRVPHGKGDPDLISVTFRGAHNTVLYEFAGRVVQGDIVVFSGPHGACSVHGAVGRGVAENEHGRRAEFDFDVKKLVCPQHPPFLDGFFKFAMLIPEEHRAIKIGMRQPHELMVEGNVCRFSGQAVMTVRTPQGSHDIHGVVYVVASDFRRPEGTGDPDHLSVRFVHPAGVFEYAGRVVLGDIHVFIRQRH